MEVDENNQNTRSREGERQENEPEEQFSGNSQQGQQNIDNTPLFHLYKRHAREICPILKALMFRDHCSITVCHEGIRIVVDDQHTEVASAYFKFDQFSDFIIRVPEVNLRVQMATLAETLNVLSGNNVELQMFYMGHGEPLNVIVEDEGIAFGTQLSTQLPQPVLDFEFNHALVLCKVIMSPQAVRDIVRDLDQSSPTLLLTITKSYIAFFTNGDLGRVKTQIKANSEQIELLECIEERVDHHYRMNLIRRMLSCFSLSNKVSFRIDRRGVLSVQFLVPQSDHQTVFIEYLCVADSDAYHDP